MKVESESIAIVTTTFYPHWYPGQFLTEEGTDKQTNIEKVRGDLALKTITLAKDKGFQVVVINGANNQAFTDQLSQIGTNLYPEAERGMSVSRQQGFKIACNLDRVEVICWLEPEKVSLVADCLPQAVMPILENETDVVVPTRNEQLLHQTYPDYQVHFEQKSNRLWNQMLKRYGLRSASDPGLDAWFGPKFFRNSAALVDLFTDQYLFDTASKAEKIKQIVQPELWPNAVFLPIIAALHKGFRVMGVEVPYKHPSEQTAIEQDSNELWEKRKYQQQNILLSSEVFIRSLLNLDSKLGRMRKLPK